MSTLAERVQARTDLSQQDLDHLQLLLAEWQLVADLSFADLVLWVRTHEGPWLAVAHMRPTTGPTTYPKDVVGTEVDESFRIARAFREGRIVRDGEPEWHGDTAVRREAVPVRRGDAVIAVVSRDTNLSATRVPSQLELAYLSSAGELLQMVAEGAFPFPSDDPDPEHAPRVGDGLLRLDRTGHVVYASPNASSAYRRLGVTGDLLGCHLGTVTARISAGPGRLSEPKGSAAIAAGLRFREPRDSEMEARGAVVALRVLPLFPAGEPRGALVLVRDVTELRRRDRQIMGKDATIREIHHRVKNNLQTVAALLRMQARRMTDHAARSALEESVRRVASIAAVHETLATALDEQVAFDAIATKVLDMCAEVATTGAPVTVELTGTFGVLPAEVATSLAMVLTELVQNAVEHAYPEGRPGRIQVLVDREPHVLVVQVVDDGAGLPEGFDLLASKRLGLQIVGTLVGAELGGQLVLEPALPRGTKAELRLPLGG
ncbi:MAG TPA: histidine kinase N-terminal domain-containing protein [Mycobacteriales bacterium]|nr:histidine kinase N-terminal domain-containing protein [Mycobacteriales bacterium]